MPLSRKRKRKLYPKRPCPCCGAILSEKTIERHVSGTHIPTRIKVTHAEAAHKRARFTSNLSSDPLGDLSGDSDGNESFESDSESMLDDVLPREGPSDLTPQPDFEPAPVNTADVDANRGTGPEREELEGTIRDTWSGRRARVEDYESDPEDEDFEEDVSRSQSPENSNSDQESEFEWEGMRIPSGLGLDDLVDEDLQQIIAEFAEELSEEDLDMLRTFSLKVEERLSEETWAKMMHTFHRHSIPSLKLTKARIEFLTAYRPVAYDCCVNSCICYVGPHETKTQCPYCKEARKNSAGRARKTFTYSPIIPRLKAYFKNREMIKLMKY
ncbi:hypothetical protein M413DRAFT_29075 [Hebeloma cylindrosporum]|uniref:Uncharacterized protein n=1 Tax=Hebeloma cylindrosporum TaxID=76867 RepID=A0A0C2XQL9_HEBCY|nr:hypothetical protein M413DRAFT_29075 [Hebeloma cylindrosporum h7]